MTPPARFAIVNRLTDVGPETALQVSKPGMRLREAIPFSLRSTLRWRCNIEPKQRNKSPIRFRSKEPPAGSAGKMADVHNY
jgi:hypothetical protein